MESRRDSSTLPRFMLHDTVILQWNGKQCTGEIGEWIREL